MKTYYLLFIIIISTHTIKAQERFFEFLPGWRNLKIIEKENDFISIGFTSDGIGLNHYQFSSFSENGILLDEWEFDLDSVISIESRYTNDISRVEQFNYVSGGFRTNSDRRFGTLIKFNDDFTDTLDFISFNILPGNGTLIYSHLNIDLNKIILGGFLQNTELQVYSSLMETDSLGNINWRKDFFCGSSCDLIPYHILQAADGGYFLTCPEIHNNDGSGDFFEYTAIIKTDSLGNEQYRLHPGNPDNYSVAGWVLPCDDGNYISAYSDPYITESQNPNYNMAIWLYKFDIDGDVLWEISLIDFLPQIPGFDVGSVYYITQMILSDDGTIKIVGEAETFEQGFMLNVSQDGIPLWFRLYSPPQAEGNDAGIEWTKIKGITPTSDGGYIMAGEYFSTPSDIFPDGIQTAIAVKVDEFGCLEPGCQIGDGIAEIQKTNLGLQLYPNPTNGKVNVTISSNARAKWIRVYGVTGRMVFQEPMTENSLQLDVIGLKSGIYLLEVETEDGFREVKQLLIE